MELVYLDYQHSQKINQNLIATIGQFDGIHIAHQYLINETLRLAKEKNLKSAIITFDPHPDFLIKKSSNETYVTPLNEKIAFMKKFGFDYMVVIQFDLSIMNMLPIDFVNNILLTNGVKEVVVGYDFSFGKKGMGKAIDIESLSSHQIMTHIIDKKCINGQKIGTSLIKEYLEVGKMEEVHQLLGRFYQISGEVIHGRQIGRTIHVPTANLKVSKEFATIKKGVYLVLVTVENRKYVGIANLGNNPSFNYHEHMVFETHIIDFTGDLYGKTLAIEFVKYLREEVKFPSVEAFLEQIKKDIEIARNYHFS